MERLKRAGLNYLIERHYAYANELLQCVKHQERQLTLQPMTLHEVRYLVRSHGSLGEEDFYVLMQDELVDSWHYTVHDIPHCTMVAITI